MTEDQVVAALDAMAHQTRLRMLRYLVRAGDKGAPAGEVAEAVGAAPSRASFHLSALSRTGLIVSERQARQIVYRVDYQAMGALMGYLLHDCCQGNAEVAACC
jgi:DNA-binding transcriptional ArsR family regulator